MKTLTWKQLLPKSKDQEWQMKLGRGTDRLAEIRASIVSREAFPVGGKVYQIQELVDLWACHHLDARTILAGMARMKVCEAIKIAGAYKWEWKFTRNALASDILHRKRGGRRPKVTSDHTEKNIGIHCVFCNGPSKSGPYCSQKCRESAQRLLYTRARLCTNRLH